MRRQRASHVRERHDLDRWPSGLRRTPGKCVYVKAYREFESHPIRLEVRTPPALARSAGFRAIGPAAPSLLPTDSHAVDDGSNRRDDDVGAVELDVVRRVRDDRVP